MLDADATEAAFETSMAGVRTHRDVVEVVGPDAAEYLHGQLSQDVLGLDVGHSALTLLLQPQGKIDARLRLSRLGDDRYWLDVEPGFGSATLERIERFKLRVDAGVGLNTFEMIAIRGPGCSALTAGEVLEAPDGGALLDALWPGVAGIDLLGPAVEWPAGVPEGPTEALEALRIRLGLPAMGAELDPTTIPHAAGLVESTVDFTKGCYVGQELVARIDARGSNTPTRLRGLRFGAAVDGHEVAPGDAIVADGASVGTVTSIARSHRLGLVGLGYVKRGVEVPATVTVAATAGSSLAAEVVELPLG